MSISSELEKLKSLRDDGVLTDAEFNLAKEKLLSTLGPDNNTGTGVNKIGNAAVSWVNLQWVSYAVGLIAAVLLIVFFFIPHWQSMKKAEQAFHSNFEKNKEFIDKSSKDMDARRENFNKDFDKTKREMEEFRKKNFPN
jgi:hypothetical protein